MGFLLLLLTSVLDCYNKLSTLNEKTFFQNPRPVSMEVLLACLAMVIIYKEEMVHQVVLGESPHPHTFLLETRVIFYGPNMSYIIRNNMLHQNLKKLFRLYTLYSHFGPGILEIGPAWERKTESTSRC